MFWEESNTLPLPSMNVNIRYKILYLASVGSGFLVIGCEAPPLVENQVQATSLQNNPTDVTTTVNNPLDTNEDMLRERLLESYALYWPLISSEYQHEQLPEVLLDPIPELRAFGVERVAILLRDGDASEEELQLVLNLLRDSSPYVRLASAKLLSEIDIPGLPEYVANSLSIENDPLVIEEELAFFQTRPNPKAIEPTIALLSLAPVDSAAKTLFVLLGSTEVSVELKRKIVKTVQRTRQYNNLPSLITLEAMLGDAHVKRKLIRLLQHSNPDIRRAVAKGFASSGYAAPLVERSIDPELYEFALIALQKQNGIDTFMEIMALYKPENETWNAAAFALATKLDTTSLLRADDMLKRIEQDELRLLILQSIWENIEDKSLAAKKAIARRTVPLLISRGDAVGALQLLDVFGEALVDEDLLSLRFSAAISAAAWDTAADALSVPKPWIDVWQLTLQEDPTAAAVIRQQILIRFEDQLSISQRETLELIQADSTTE